MTQPLIVGLGGTPDPNSSTGQALAIALSASAAQGAQTILFSGPELATLPLYLTPRTPEQDAFAHRLIDAVRRADGLILASPGYHGTVSGLVKNALDYLEETARDSRVYLDGLPVGLIVTAYGWQATGGALATLRSVVHALRGWPTPLGAAVNSAGGVFTDGRCTDLNAHNQLLTVGRQVATFADSHWLRQPK